MDADLVLIFAFVTALVLIVLTFGTVAGQRSRAHKERKMELQVRIEQAKAEQLKYSNGDNRRIEERLRVLERIATDGNNALAAQIDELRTLDALEDAGEAAR